VDVFKPSNGKPFTTPSQAYDCCLTERKGRLAYDYQLMVKVAQRLLKSSKGNAALLYVQQHFYRNPLIKLHPH
jgi:hypothetical protein